MYMRCCYDCLSARFILCIFSNAVYLALCLRAYVAYVYVAVNRMHSHISSEVHTALYVKEVNHTNTHTHIYTMYCRWWMTG